MTSSKRLNAWLGGFGFALLAVGCSDCGGPSEPVNAEIQFVADRTLLENSFNSTFRFEVRLDATYEEEVTVDFETLEGTAKAGEDYLSQAGTLVFAPGIARAQGGSSQSVVARGSTFLLPENP